MGLIEQAARRLEELRRAGIEVPGPANAPGPAPAPTPLPHVAHSAEPARAHAAPESRPHAAPEPSRVHRSPLARIDLNALSAQGYITPENPRTRTADEFRVIKRPLIANASPDSPAPVKNGNLIMVTSSAPHEGKTFSAVNLAMSFAMELDRTVLLVDADVARPSLPRVLGLPETRGLLDRLENPQLDLSEILFRTNVKKLSFLPCGRPNPRATEMLASDNMTALVHELGSRYPDRLIIFDSPPLLVTTEARELASHMGQIVFVVSAESTPVADVQRALATIEDCPVKLMLLNKASRTSGGESSYGYGYGYGYGR